VQYDPICDRAEKLNKINREDKYRKLQGAPQIQYESPENYEQVLITSEPCP
jgi:hypothetical protein